MGKITSVTFAGKNLWLLLSDWYKFRSENPLLAEAKAIYLAIVRGTNAVSGPCGRMDCKHLQVCIETTEPHWCNLWI